MSGCTAFGVVKRGYLRHGVRVVGRGGLVGLVVPVVPLCGVEGVEGSEVGEEGAHGALDEVLVLTHGGVAAAGAVGVVVGQQAGFDPDDLARPVFRSTWRTPRWGS